MHVLNYASHPTFQPSSSSLLFPQSGGIAEYAYFSGWQKSGKYAARLKPYIIMIMTQSLHPCKLTAGKFAGVDLETFLKVGERAERSFFFVKALSMCLHFSAGVPTQVERL